MEVPSVAAASCVQTTAHGAIRTIQAAHHLEGLGGGRRGGAGGVIIAQGLLLLDELGPPAQRVPSTGRCRGRMSSIQLELQLKLLCLRGIE